MSTNFVQLVEQMRREMPSKGIPSFDPNNGNEAALYLFVLEAPGPRALKTGVISFENPDRTAANFHTQLERAGIDRRHIAIWNIVPWYLGNESGTKIRAAVRADTTAGLKYLSQVVSLMPNLKCILLVGGAARQAHTHLSRTTRARILSCHHPSPRAMNLNAQAADENVEIFRFMLASTAEG